MFEHANEAWCCGNFFGKDHRGEKARVVTNSHLLVSMWSRTHPTSLASCVVTRRAAHPPALRTNTFGPLQMSGTREAVWEVSECHDPTVRVSRRNPLGRSITPRLHLTRRMSLYFASSHLTSLNSTHFNSTSLPSTSLRWLRSIWMNQISDLQCWAISLHLRVYFISWCGYKSGFFLPLCFC